MFKKKKTEVNDEEEAADDQANGEEAADGGADEGRDSGGAPSVGGMRRGDYMVHVFIEKAKDIKVPDGGTVDPIVEVTSLS